MRDKKRHMMPEKPLNATKAAEILGVTPPTIKKMVQRGEFPTGWADKGIIRVPRHEVETWLAVRRQRAV